jgi:transposase
MRDELTDQQWARLLPLLPLQEPSQGRPANDHRTVLNAILWILRTGAPWRDLPTDAGVCWKTLSMPHPMDMSSTGVGKPDFTGGVSGGRDPDARDRGALPHINQDSSHTYLLA